MAGEFLRCPIEVPFDLSALIVTPKLAPVLSFASIAAIRGDHSDSVFVLGSLVVLVGVGSLSPINRTGSSSRKLPTITSSTSLHSASEALWTDTARRRLLPAATGQVNSQGKAIAARGAAQSISRRQQITLLGYL
jgi:hypothetical protein